MRRKSFVTGVLTRAALGLALSAGAWSAASAGTITFTWNPSATGNTTAPTFSANAFTVADFATIGVPTDPSVSGSVSEQGFLEFNGFLLNGNPVSTVHTTGTGGYGIYESFTATSHLAPCSEGLCGAFDSITANVYLYSTANGLASYSFATPTSAPTITLPAGANQVLLASESGPIGVSPNLTQITDGVPSASVDTAWTSLFGPGFFISPPITMVLDLDQAFTNTVGVITKSGPGCSTTGTNCIYQIHAGGGQGDFLSTSVPEPASLVLLGFGLVSLGLIRGRRA